MFFFLFICPGGVVSFNDSLFLVFGQSLSWATPTRSRSIGYGRRADQNKNSGVPNALTQLLPRGRVPSTLGCVPFCVPPSSPRGLRVQRSPAATPNEPPHSGWTILSSQPPSGPPSDLKNGQASANQFKPNKRSKKEKSVPQRKEKEKKSSPPRDMGSRVDIYAPMMPSFGSCAIRRTGESVMCLVVQGEKKKKKVWIWARSQQVERRYEEMATAPDLVWGGFLPSFLFRWGEAGREGAAGRRACRRRS